MCSSRRSLALAALVGALAAACAGLTPRGPDGRPATPLVIGTGAIGGVYHSLGGAVCRLVNLETARHGLACRAARSPGALDTVQALRQRRVDLAVVQSDIQRDAVAGRGPFAGQGGYAALRAVFSAHEEPFAVVVRPGSGIRTPADLAGKRVNLGTPGSGHRVTAERLLAALGLARADLALVTEFAPHEQNDALCAGRVDAVVYAAESPNGIVEDAIRRCGGRLVEVSGPRVDALLGAYPEYSPVVVPAGTYPGHDADVRTFGARATVVTTAAEPEAVVYEVVRAVFDHFDDFRRLQAAFAPLEAREMARAQQRAPLHPGAARYYRERGWLP
jgi:TRAP transporter TAXI family solute receptor